MAKKIMLFSWDSFAIAWKIIAIFAVVMVIGFVIKWLLGLIIPVLGLVVAIIWWIFSLLLSGYFAQKWYG